MLLVHSHYIVYLQCYSGKIVQVMSLTNKLHIATRLKRDITLYKVC